LRPADASKCVCGRLCPGPRWGAYNALPDPLAGFRGEEWKGNGRGRKGKGEWEGNEI